MFNNKPAKTKKVQPKTETEVQGRDSMYTPNYAIDLIGKFIPTKNVWECAAGDGRFGARLETKWNKDVRYTDINGSFDYWNFLEKRDTNVAGQKFTIVTNPPFSLKKQFFEMCMEYGVPFALLIPLDYSQWLIDSIDKYNCEKLIPNRRVSYLTPNILKRVQYGEIWEKVRNFFPENKKYSEIDESHWLDVVYENSKEFPLYKKINDVPNYLLSKYSSSDFHSGYLTHGFNFGKSETFIDLPISEMKYNLV